MKSIVPILGAAFLLSVHFGTVLYINSSNLNNYFPSSIVNLLFFTGALFNALLFLFASKFIRIIGKRKFLFIFLTLTFHSALGLAISTKASHVALSFLVSSGVLYMIYYALDIFLEEHSQNKLTGGLRGIYFTFISLGIAIGPLIVSAFAQSNSFQLVYFVASALLLPIFLLAIFFFKSHKPREHHPYHHHYLLHFKSWWNKKNIRRITLIRLVLEFFYSIMIIYAPIYLHTIIGFSWQELGLMLSIALLPFIILEWPAGRLADLGLGEKEILVTGFLLSITAILIMPFLNKVLLAWILVLFLSRIGVSLIEIMTESYFFKKIDAQDTDLISIFRLSRPVGIMMGSLIGASFLLIFPLNKIFFILALVFAWGLRESYLIRDTA